MGRQQGIPGENPAAAAGEVAAPAALNDLLILDLLSCGRRARSVGAQRLDRIDPRGAARGQVGGRRADRDE